MLLDEQVAIPASNRDESMFFIVLLELTTWEKQIAFLLEKRKHLILNVTEKFKYCIV